MTGDLTGTGAGRGGGQTRSSTHSSPLQSVKELHGLHVADPVLVGDVSRGVAGHLVEEAWLDPVYKRERHVEMSVSTLLSVGM